MDCQEYITIPAERKKGQHLQREERGAIQHLKRQGLSNRATAREIGCSPSTVGYELARGTPLRKSNKGRKPGYSAKHGEAVYKANRKRSRKPHKIENCPHFVSWVLQVFKTITVDNGSEFADFAQIEAWGSKVFFAHPYSSWERAQNERHNGLFRAFVPEGVSIELFTDEDILAAADQLNGRPRRKLGYCTPEELFEAFLDSVFAASLTDRGSGSIYDQGYDDLFSTLGCTTCSCNFRRLYNLRKALCSS